MIRVGIPRALLYYEYYPMWKTFFETLGAEVVVSPPTTQTTVTEGSSRVVTDTCLPVKVFCGHVVSLIDKCDYIFIPAIRSVKARAYNCAKFLGLPDMTRAVIPGCPPILELEIDVNRGKRNLYQEIYKLGRSLSWNPLRVRQAALAAWQAHLEYQMLLSNRKLTSPRAIDILSDSDGSKTTPGEPGISRGTVALIGHPYLLYDEHINHRLIHHLEQAHYTVLTPEMVNTTQLEASIARLAGRAYWTYEEEVVGAGGHYLESGVDGIIGIMAFGCGPDSVMMDTVRRQASRLKSTPFMSLTIEEHTAAAGLMTRLEAFLDMIQIRKRKPICV
ncbi:acyl-CoA dehydratase activase-related protein [Chloroflexota bacterium]